MSQLYDMLEKAILWREEKDQWLHRLRTEGRIGRAQKILSMVVIFMIL